jgi:hypothetical protein
MHNQQITVLATQRIVIMLTRIGTIEVAPIACIKEILAVLTEIGEQQIIASIIAAV